MIEPKKGLKLVGRSDLGTRRTQAEVTNVTKTTITVEVERTVHKQGIEQIEKRTRELTHDTWRFFVLGYECVPPNTTIQKPKAVGGANEDVTP